MSLNQHPAESQERELLLEPVAAALYESERVEHPTRNMPPWERANRVLRADARYRAQGAHSRISSTIKAVLVERVAQTLATLDGFIWPACEGRTRQICAPEEYTAIVAERRQRYRHKARLVIAAYETYMDMDAPSEPEAVRASVIRQAKAHQLEDVQAVQAWKRLRDTTVTPFNHEGEVLGDGRR